MNVYIYALSDPRDGDNIRYVGKSINPYKRVTLHMTPSELALGTHKCQWLKSLKRDNVKPFVRILEVCTDENWVERERYWIRYYRDSGYKLVNIADGGNSGPRLVGKDHPNYGKHLSPDTVEKIRNANTGKKLSSETKEKIRRANLGKTPSFIPSPAGRIVSEETRKKLSDANRGRRPTEETIEAARRKNTGRKLTEDQKMMHRFSGSEAAKNKSSKYIGVSFCKTAGCWQSSATVNGKIKFLGRFATEEEAARRYDAYLKECLGDHVAINFPDGE